MSWYPAAAHGQPHLAARHGRRHMVPEGRRRARCRMCGAQTRGHAYNFELASCARVPRLTRHRRRSSNVSGSTQVISPKSRRSHHLTAAVRSATSMAVPPCAGRPRFRAWCGVLAMRFRGKQQCCDDSIQLRNRRRLTTQRGEETSQRIFSGRGKLSGACTSFCMWLSWP